MVFNLPIDVVEELLLSGAHYGARAVPLSLAKLLESQDTEHYFHYDYLSTDALFCDIYTQDGWKEEMERRVLFSARRAEANKSSEDTKDNSTVEPKRLTKERRTELEQLFIQAAMQGNQSEVTRIGALLK